MSSQTTIGWTIHVEILEDQQDAFLNLLEMFKQQIELLDGTVRFHRSSVMIPNTQLADSGAETAVQTLRQQGVPEEQLGRIAKIMQAQTGEGSWQAVIDDLEEEIAQTEKHDNLNQFAKRFGLLLQLAKYAMNVGDKPRAINAFKQAEKLFLETPFEQFVGDTDAVIPQAQFERVKQMYDQQLNELRNWLFI